MQLLKKMVHIENRENCFVQTKPPQLLSSWQEETQLQRFFIPFCISLSFLFILFLFSLINHPGLVRWDYSFSSISVKFKSRKQCPETAWHQYLFSALQVARPCCSWLFSSMRLQGAMSTGDRSYLLQFCCCILLLLLLLHASIRFLLAGSCAETL